MELVLTEEQELLKATAREFVQERAPVAELRKRKVNFVSFTQLFVVKQPPGNILFSASH